MIVGGGPVGLSLAADLGTRDVACVVVDGKAEFGEGSRGLCYAKRTLEILDRLGIGERALAKGVTWQLGKVFHKEELLYEFNLLPESGHKMPAFINLQQYYLEQFVYERSSRQSAGAFDIELEVLLQTAAMRAAGREPHRLSIGSTRHMYWTVAQLVAHHTSNGCNLRPGDLLGSGTISAPTRDGYGSLLEISRGGKEPVALPDGETRAFLEDGDEIFLRARAQRDGAVSIGFGECRAVLLSAGPHTRSGEASS